jgi:hypothetical protein
MADTRYYILDAERRVVPARDVVEWGHFFESGARIVDQTDAGGRGSRRFFSASIIAIIIGLTPQAPKCGNAAFSRFTSAAGSPYSPQRWRVRGGGFLAMPGLDLTLDELLLDLENPRISRAESQREALQKIIEDQDVKLVVLAESIVADGLNPMDRWLVLRSPIEVGKYIVLEGNRRLATIRLLNNRHMLDSIEVRSLVKKRFVDLANQFDLDRVARVRDHDLRRSARSGAMALQLLGRCRDRPCRRGAPGP